MCAGVGRIQNIVRSDKPETVKNHMGRQDKHPVPKRAAVATRLLALATRTGYFSADKDSCVAFQTAERHGGANRENRKTVSVQQTLSLRSPKS